MRRRRQELIEAEIARMGEVNELAERLAELGSESHGYIGVIRESLYRSLFPGLDDDLRMQPIGHRMSDLYRQHPYEPGDS